MDNVLLTIAKNKYCVIPFVLDEESRKSSNSVKKSKVISSQNWSRFLVISSIEYGDLTKLSPFAIQKAIVGLAGEPKSV